MMTDQTRAPIVEALETFESENAISFGVPGHKSGKGAPSDVVSLLGKYAFRGDATTLKGIDDRRESKHVQHHAEELAAQAWGADECFFSTNGSSLSNHVAVMTVANPGDTVLVARNSHKSLIAACIIAHVRPVFLQPDYDEEWDVEHGIPTQELEEKLNANPNTKGVFVTSPSFYGVSSDLKRLAEICHRRGVPFIVDEAWGAHYPFHPEMPPTAMSCGADIAVTSIHKTMAGLEQASILLFKSELIESDRFRLCYDLFESTSPSVPILSTIDATRRQFLQKGKDLIDDVLANARWTIEKLAAIPGIRVMGKEILNGDGRYALEEMKIYFDVGELGLNGYEAEDWLMAEQKISMSLSDQRHFLATFTVGNKGSEARKLVRGIKKMAEWAEQDSENRMGPPKDMPKHRELKTEMAMSPGKLC